MSPKDVSSHKSNWLSAKSIRKDSIYSICTMCGALCQVLCMSIIIRKLLLSPISLGGMNGDRDSVTRPSSVARKRQESEFKLRSACLLVRVLSRLPLLGESFPEPFPWEGLGYLRHSSDTRSSWAPMATNEKLNSYEVWKILEPLHWPDWLTNSPVELALEGI